ncbi:MAG: glycosyltransferase family 39 protein [Methanobacterium sp.]
MKILDKLWSSLTKRVDLHILIIFILVILLTRIPFICKYLFDWDSVGYALGFQQFNMALDQPQAPGYIFYVALGKIVNLIFNNPNDTMIFINIIFSIFTVILVYYLAKQIYSREVAVIASVLLIFFPTFWFYGETSTIYICEALFATLIAYTSYQLLKGDDRFLYISTFILGLSGGFRQDLILFMFPLWFFCLVYQDLNYKKIFKALIVLIASIMLWFIPTIILAGGYGNYSLINQDTLIGSFQSLSIFFGAGIVNQLSMDSRLLSWTVLGIGIISSLILWIFISLNLRRIIKVSNFRNPDLIFMFLWFLPAFLFYLLIYIAKPGYVLTFLPVFSLIIGYVIVNFSFKLNKRFKLVSKNSFVLLLVSIIVFLSVVQFFIPGNVAGYSVIELKDMNIHYFNESLNEFNPNNTLIFYGYTDD